MPQRHGRVVALEDLVVGEEVRRAEQGQPGARSRQQHALVAAEAAVGAIGVRRRPRAPTTRRTPDSRRRRCRAARSSRGTCRPRARGSAPAPGATTTRSASPWCSQQPRGRRTPEVAAGGDHDRRRCVHRGPVQRRRGPHHVDLARPARRAPGPRPGPRGRRGCPGRARRRRCGCRGPARPTPRSPPGPRPRPARRGGGPGTGRPASSSRTRQGVVEGQHAGRRPPGSAARSP